MYLYDHKVEHFFNIWNYLATCFLEMKNEKWKGFYLLARRLRLFQGKVRSHCRSITGHNASARILCHGPCTPSRVSRSPVPLKFNQQCYDYNSPPKSRRNWNLPWQEKKKKIQQRKVRDSFKSCVSAPRSALPLHATARATRQTSLKRLFCFLARKRIQSASRPATSPACASATSLCFLEDMKYKAEVV